MKGFVILSSAFLVAGLLALGVAGCSSQTGPDAVAAEEVAIVGDAPAEVPTLETFAFSLETAVTNGKIVYIGVGGTIDGMVNPDLEVKPGMRVQVTLINGDGMQHDISFPDFAVTSSLVRWLGDSRVLTFVVDAEKSGVFPYYCTVPGHRQAGQEGRLVVGDRALAASSQIN